ncbi:hypothetical protein CPB86DRAFT_165027 [Serendipita vermifera]|nr:hypothetical protein CPB86DRAFT_165027 [Serendipita vermifera]
MTVRRPSSRYGNSRPMSSGHLDDPRGIRGGAPPEGTITRKSTKTQRAPDCLYVCYHILYVILPFFCAFRGIAVGTRPKRGNDRGLKGYISLHKGEQRRSLVHI